MARTGTSLLNLGMWNQGDNPGAGSKTVDNDGLNGNWQKIDTAVGTEHNTNGTHIANSIVIGYLNSNTMDGSSLEYNAGGCRIKASGVQGSMLNSNTADGSTLELSGTTLRIKDLGVTTAKINASAVTTAKIADDNVTTDKLEYSEYIALISQSGTSNPTVTVIKNTLSGAPTWTRTGVGTYQYTLGAGFTVGKTVAWITNGLGSPVANIFEWRLVDTNGGLLYSYADDGEINDSLLSSASFMLRVYP